MAKTYLFLKPSELPLAPDRLTNGSVHPIDPAEAEARLKEVLPSLVWTSGTEASGETDEGWVEFTQTDEGAGQALSLRCSLRADYSRLVQAICDHAGWVAFDEEPTFYQPFHPPTPCD